MKIARHVGRLERERPPELIERAVEGASRRQHPDDRVRLVVEENRAVDDRGIRSELVDPEHMAEDDHAILASLVLIGKKRAASLRLNAEDLEVAGRDPRPTKLHRIAAPRERRRAAALGGHEVEDGVIRLPVEEIQRGDAVAVAAGRLLEDTDDPIGIRVRQRLEQDAVNEAEDRGVGADAERQREDRDRCKSRTLRQGSPAVTQVLEQRIEHGQAAPVAVDFFRLLDPAELHKRLPPRF